MTIQQKHLALGIAATCGAIICAMLFFGTGSMVLAITASANAGLAYFNFAKGWPRNDR